MNTQHRVVGITLMLALCGAAHGQNVRVVVQPGAGVAPVGVIGAQFGASGFQQAPGISLTPSMQQSLSPSLALPTPHSGLVAPKSAPAAIQSAPAAASLSQVSPSAVLPSVARSVSPAVSQSVSPVQAAQSAPKLEPVAGRRHHNRYADQAASQRRARSESQPTASRNARDAERTLKAEEGDRAARFDAIFDGSDLHSQAAAAVAVAPVAAALQSPAAQPAARKAHLGEAEGKVGRQLLEALHNITGRGVRVSEYRDASQYMFSVADNVEVNGVRGVIDAYSGIFVPGRGTSGDSYKERGDADGDGYRSGTGMNVEHTWPQSYFNKAQPMRSDLHHLMPTFEHSNSERSRYPFGEVKDSDVIYRTSGGAKLGRNGVFEPPDAVKGRVARGMLYFYTRYYNRDILPRGVMEHFWNSRIEMFMRWNREFPPTPEEMRRNDLVEKYQGNRNPFTDDPALVEKIGAEGFKMSGGRQYAAPPSEGEVVRGQEQSGRSSGYSSGSGKDGQRREKWDHRKAAGHSRSRR